MFTKLKALFASANLHWKDAAYILVIGAAVMWITTDVRQYIRDNAPVSDYFVVNQIGIPNFAVGENPKVLYDRVVMKEFSATFTAEIQDAATLQSVCASTKTVIYSPDKSLPKDGPTLSWLMYREPLPDCMPDVGTYRVQICWTIERLDDTPARMCATSNIFSVRAMELK